VAKPKASNSRVVSLRAIDARLAVIENMLVKIYSTVERINERERVIIDEPF